MPRPTKRTPKKVVFSPPPAIGEDPTWWNNEGGMDEFSFTKVIQSLTGFIDKRGDLEKKIAGFLLRHTELEVLGRRHPEYPRANPYFTTRNKIAEWCCSEQFALLIDYIEERVWITPSLQGCVDTLTAFHFNRGADDE
ncbi:MAG: hypothetical protein Q8M31_02055 [Beijerinckiaceae bacterium]|nr:hypothetical protein [Beijerinckiaceae bacterium]